MDQHLPGVFKEMCSTCVFRPGNPMQLRPGALKRVVEGNLASGTLLMCHTTTFGQAAEEIACKGFFDRYGEGQMVVQVINRIGGFRQVPVSDAQAGG